MPKCYQLVGVPGAGKSTWITKQDWLQDCVVISTDNHVEAQARIEGKTYNDVFKDFMPFAVKMMADDVVKAREAGKDIVWDQTSTTVKSRARKFDMLPDYEHIAVVFQIPEKEELERRLGSRPGKNIPWNVMQGMIKHFDMPSENEGFKEIWYVF